jgi:hypothetical protein
MSELFIARVFEEHVATRRGSAWPPQQQQQQQASVGSSSSSSSRAGSLPSIKSGTSPPRSPNKPAAVATTGDSSSANDVVWPPPLPADAAGPRDEMDLLAFADFVLAWDHRSHPAAIPYFFKIFDINHQVKTITVNATPEAVLLNKWHQ